MRTHLALAGVALLLSFRGADAADPPAKAPTKIKIDKLGQAGEAERFTAVALGWKESPDLAWKDDWGRNMPADPGVKRVTVSVVVVNRSKETSALDPRHFTLLDRGGRIGYTPLLEPVGAMGDIAPGERRRFEVVFRVLKVSKGFKLLFANVPFESQTNEQGLNFLPFGDPSKAGVLAPGVLLYDVMFAAPLNAVVGIFKVFEAIGSALGGGKKGLPRPERIAAILFELGPDQRPLKAPAKLAGENPWVVAKAEDGLKAGDLVLTPVKAKAFADKRIAPAAGFKFIQVEATVENRGKSDAILTPAVVSVMTEESARFGTPDFAAIQHKLDFQDLTNMRLGFDEFARELHKRQDLPLPPALRTPTVGAGKTETVNLVFEVPKNEKDFVLRVKGPGDDAVPLDIRVP